jgi:hypothetical protein
VVAIRIRKLRSEGHAKAQNEPFSAEVDTPIMSRDAPYRFFSLACAAIVLGWLLFLTFAE